MDPQPQAGKASLQRSRALPQPGEGPPPAPRLGAVGWVRQNLFSTWYNGVLTVVCVWLLYAAGTRVLAWVFATAQWTVVRVNLRLFLAGRYPQDQTWRIWAVVLFVAGLGVASWAAWNAARRHPAAAWFRRRLPLAWFLSFPVVVWLVRGGAGLPVVDTSLWSGLLLTLLLAVVGIVGSFPLGILLALGRRSSLPAVRALSILYIETVRGVPLITILFMAQVMFPVFMPEGVRPDRVLRAMAGLVLFTSAYMAENVRGGLQAVPRGQVEAAMALGLKSHLVVLLIVLPQALRAVIPAIVGQFISLFKDTSLVAIVGLSDLTGIARSILAQPQFLGRYAEVYLFVALVYWIFSYSMSLASRRLERQLGVGER